MLRVTSSCCRLLIIAELPYEPPFEHADLAFIGRAVASRSKPQFSSHLEDFEPEEDSMQAADFALPGKS